MKLIILLVMSMLCYAECITDLYSVGLSADSVTYELEDTESSQEATFGSSYGMGIKIGKIYYCPQQKREYYSYAKLRYFSMKDAKKDERFEQISSDITLLEIGVDVRLIQNASFEYLIDVGVREEFSPVSNNEELNDEKYANLKVLAGARYFIKSNAREDYTINAKLGLVAPVLIKDTEMGAAWEVTAEYFKRMKKNYSIRADLFASGFKQEVSGIIINRTELGARYNYIFRY